MSRTTIHSPYMEFSKLRAAAPFNLATSGVMDYPLAELPLDCSQLEINDPSPYGYPPLLERLAAKNGVPPDCVVSLNGGTSLANHLAMAAICEPGDDVLIETPGYELLDTTARFLGLAVRHFERRFENAFLIDPADIQRALTPRTRLIVVTNLHNPSGVATDQDTLRSLAALVRSAGARVLVDEVYLDMMFEHAPPTSFQLDPEIFVVTNSLTKTYGLSGLRCGWVLAEPQLAQRIRRVHDVFGATPAHPAERLSVIALDHLAKIAARAQALLHANRALLHQFLDRRSDLEVVRSPFGTVVFPRLKQGSVDRLHELCRAKYETSFVPGKFFAQPQHFRLGVGGDTEMTRHGLARLAAALDELA